MVVMLQQAALRQWLSTSTQKGDKGLDSTSSGRVSQTSTNWCILYRYNILAYIIFVNDQKNRLQFWRKIYDL